MPALYKFPSCCGCDIIAGFPNKPEDVIEYKKDPVNVDRWGNPDWLKDENGKKIPLKTAKEGLVELIGTKSSWGDTGALPDRGFVCILSQTQLKKWMPTLRELGFVFLMKWNNSVHELSMNYLFGIAKHNGSHDVPPPLELPEGWADLPEPGEDVIQALYGNKPGYVMNSDILEGDADQDLLDELNEYDDYEEDPMYDEY